MSDYTDYEDGWDWRSEIPETIWHQVADINGIAPCCGKTTWQSGDGLTPDPARVNCPGPT